MEKELKAISIEEWNEQYEKIKYTITEPPFGGNLIRHLKDGDYRLRTLKMDSAPESLNLWNFLLTEESRLWEARKSGKAIIGTMKDLGTIPIIAYSCPDTVAFYPDGAWWIPCIMELSAGLFDIADSMGIDESFCPVRAMLGAFANENHFPRPDALICSTGAVCDDFSAIAQRLQGMGFPIHWWEIPRRSTKDDGEIALPGGNKATKIQQEVVKEELQSIVTLIEATNKHKITNEMLTTGINEANKVRRVLEELRETVFTAKIAPIPALEMLICEMLAIHYCSDYHWTLSILTDMLSLAKRRVRDEKGYFGTDAVPVFWINPVADLKAMNILEESGGRICGTEYLFSHALDQIPTNIPPLEALSQMALADPMIGPTEERAERIINDIKKFGSKALIISKIPGASHCTIESKIIKEMVENELSIPTLEIEIPPLCDSMSPSIRTRIEALIETTRCETLF